MNYKQQKYQLKTKMVWPLAPELDHLIWAIVNNESRADGQQRRLCCPRRARQHCFVAVEALSTSVMSRCSEGVPFPSIRPVPLTWCECSMSVLAPSWLIAPRPWCCLYCWQDVYRSTYPGNSLCMFTENLQWCVNYVETILKKRHLKSTLSGPRPLQRLHSQGRRSSSRRGWHSMKNRCGASLQFGENVQ